MNWVDFLLGVNVGLIGAGAALIILIKKGNS